MSVWIVIDDFAWFNIFFALLMLFGCYITLVKSGVLIDKNADGVNNLNFDILSIMITAYLLIVMLRKIL